MELPGVNVRYVTRQGSLPIRNFRLLKNFNAEIKKSYDAIFVNYIRGISLVKLLNPSKNIIFDIRTLSVSPSLLRRGTYNFFLKLESLFFKNVSIVSDDIAKNIGIKNYFLLPLGADAISPSSAKSAAKTDDLHLLYVGTLRNRDIIKCVKGFHKYCVRNLDEQAKFTIVGDSTHDELVEIKKYVTDNNLENQVITVGRVPHNELETFFKQANVGVSFIPMTKYYDFQPPTKTFEYLLSGIPVIATKTRANKEILINTSDSVLINDDENEFAGAVSRFKNNISNVNSAAVAAGVQTFSWKSIIQQRFVPLIRNIGEV
jgi:glycosyltransferase involved in cell wall biosynthesis